MASVPKYILPQVGESMRFDERWNYGDVVVDNTYIAERGFTTTSILAGANTTCAICGAEVKASNLVKHDKWHAALNAVLEELM